MKGKIIEISGTENKKVKVVALFQIGKQKYMLYADWVAPQGETLFLGMVTIVGEKYLVFKPKTDYEKKIGLEGVQKILSRQLDETITVLPVDTLTKIELVTTLNLNKGPSDYSGFFQTFSYINDQPIYPAKRLSDQFKQAVINFEPRKRSVVEELPPTVETTVPTEAPVQSLTPPVVAEPLPASVELVVPKKVKKTSGSRVLLIIMVLLIMLLIAILIIGVFYRDEITSYLKGLEEDNSINTTFACYMEDSITESTFKEQHSVMVKYDHNLFEQAVETIVFTYTTYEEYIQAKELIEEGSDTVIYLFDDVNYTITTSQTRKLSDKTLQEEQEYYTQRGYQCSTDASIIPVSKTTLLQPITTTAFTVDNWNILIKSLTFTAQTNTIEVEMDVTNQTDDRTLAMTVSFYDGSRQLVRTIAYQTDGDVTVKDDVHSIVLSDATISDEVVALTDDNVVYIMIVVE